MKAGKALARKFITYSFIVFATSTTLQLAAAFIAFGQNIKGQVTVQQSEKSEKADEYFQEALKLCGAKDQSLAREHLAQARRLWLEALEPEKSARASLQMGDCSSQAKSFLDALFYYRQMLGEKSISTETRALAFKAIAKVYKGLYHSDLAAYYFKKAVDQARIANNVSIQAEVLSELATLYHQTGETQLALTCVKQVQSLIQKKANDDAEAAIFFLTGQIDHENGLAQSSQASLEKSLAIYQRTGNKEAQVKVLCAISDLYRFSGQYQLALQYAQQAEESAGMQVKADNLGSRDMRWRALLALARVQRALGQKEAATRSYFRMLAQIEAIWLSIATATDFGSVAFGEERQAPYREFVDLLIETNRISEAYLQVEQSKLRSILGLMEARRRNGQLKSEDQSSVIRELSRSIARQRTQLFSPQIKPKEREKIESEIEESKLALEEVRANAEMELTRDRVGWVRPASVKQIQKEIGHDNRFVLEFFLGEKKSFLWLISSDKLSVEILPGQKQIEESVKEYIAAVSTRPNNLYLERQITGQKKLAEKLCSILFGSLSEQIAQSQKLIIVPDGILYYLPFEALIHKGSYLLEDHEINYLPSATMLSLLQSPGIKSESRGKMDLLAFGDPIFEPEPKLPKLNGIHQKKQVLRTSDGFYLPALPNTHNEVVGISHLFSAGQSQVYLREGSTEEAFKSESLQRYRRLHVATHSLIDERKPSRSAVILTLDNNPDEDGFLEVDEIAELNLDCDLVVLSACQTGRGQLLSGEGIVGLSRAFFYAGARSVVVSLWNVSDISTSQLMRSFYHHMLGGVGNAAALREAKLQMAKSHNETQHPYYWAPFIIIGNP